MDQIARTPGELARWLQGRSTPMALDPPWLGKLSACPIPRSYPMCVDSQRQRLPRVDELRLLAQAWLAPIGSTGSSEQGGADGVRKASTGSWSDAGSPSGSMQMTMVGMASSEGLDLSWSVCRRLVEMELPTLFGGAVEEGVDLAIDAGACWLIIGPNMVEGPRALEKNALGQEPEDGSAPARDGVEAAWASAAMELSVVYGRLALAASLRDGADVEADAILGPLMQRLWTEHEAGEVAASAQRAPVRAHRTL